MKQKLTKLFLFLIISLGIMSILRLSIFLIYPNDFISLDFNETLLSFLMGTRVDMISILTINVLIILAMFLPFRFSSNFKYNQFIGYFWFMTLSIITFVIMADIIYFEFVHRHFGSEVKAMSNDTHIILDMIIEYKALFLFYLFICFGLFKTFQKIINIKIQLQEKTFFKQLGLFLAIFIFLTVGIRGKIEGKPFNITDAFAVNKSASGNLSLNGFYTLYRTVSNKKKIYNFYDDNEALKTTTDILINPRFKFVDEKYPLVRGLTNIQNKTTHKHNIVLVLLESWSAKYVDSYGHNNLKATPNFDKLAKDGLVFDNFYANGQRSIEGITALFSGIPPTIGLPYIGSGLELSNLSYLGTIAKNNGYHTVAMQSSLRGSFRVDSITKLAGFDRYFGQEDMSWDGDEDKDKKPRFGIWDGNMFNKLFSEIKNIKKPFVSFCFTATTHAPFVSPGKKWEIYPHNNKNLFGYLNTLKYADDKLGLFMQKCKKEPWFDDTIFIFMADHTIGFGDDSGMFEGTNIKIEDRELENMRIPLLIYAPKIFSPKHFDTIGSQADMMPTIIDMLNLKGSFSSMSNSLIHPTKNQFAIFLRGQTIGMVDKSGYILHTLDKSLESTGDKDIEKRLLSSYQTTTKLLKQNRWYK